MPSPEGIVAKLRQVDVLASQGRPVAEAVRTIGVTNVAIRIDRELKSADVIESWRRHYNARRPHSAVGYKPQGSEADRLAFLRSAIRQAGGDLQRSFRRAAPSIT